MSKLAETTETRTAGQGQTLVVQSGIERTNTIDLMREVNAEALEIADDVYEAVARVGGANQEGPINSVFVPLMIPEYSAERIVQAFKRIDARVHLVLIAPTGRREACSAAIKAGFDNVLEIPSTAHEIAEVLSSRAPSIPADAPRTELDLAPPPPPARSTSRQGTAGESAAPAIEDADLGDIDLVDSILEGYGELNDTAIRMMRVHLGTDDVHLILPEDEWHPDGRTESPVCRGDRMHGTLVSSTIGIEDLERWAEWLSRWMDLKWTVEDLARKAETDELTGAGNRRAFDRVLQETIDTARRERRVVTLMVFDIDNFKSYNDDFGHEAGDAVLRETVQLLEATIRRDDHVFRIGGDEFVVIFGDTEGPRGENSTPPESVEQIAHRFQSQVCSLRFPQLGVDAPGSLSISAGLATFPWDGHDGQTLLRHADHLALESKRAGKNLITFGPGARQNRRE